MRELGGAGPDAIGWDGKAEPSAGEQPPLVCVVQKDPRPASTRPDEEKDCLTAPVRRPPFSRASTRPGEEKDGLTAPVRRPPFSRASTRPGEAYSLLQPEHAPLPSDEAASLLPASMRPEIR